MKRLGAFIAFLGGITACSAQPFYTPGTPYNEQVACVDQASRPIPFAWIELIPVPYVQSNAHLHDDPGHPVSSVTPSYGYADAQGFFRYTMRTTLVGQQEGLLYRCVAPGGTLNGGFIHRVGYSDLYYTHHENIWRKIGGTDTGANTGHGTTDFNRYMRQDAAYGLYYATQRYLQLHPDQTRVCTNDMALPWGGKFDIEALRGRPWVSPHVSHDRGTAADVAGPGSGQCPANEQVIVADFIRACEQFGGLWNVNHADHAHCSWASAATFPH